VTRPAPSRPGLPWLLPLAALSIGILGITAVWLALSWTLQGPVGWLAPVAALDMVLMLRLAGAPPGRRRAALAALGTAVAITLSYWMIAATQMGWLLGLSPLESAQRLGPVLAGELIRHATSTWDLAWAALALLIAGWFGR
jgi:hypothetical protein